MQYIIFGCGVTGRMALHFLGFNRVAYFASNHDLDAEGYKRIVDGKKVISFGEMQHLAQSDEYLIVIASEKYARQLGEQVRAAGVTRYFVFHESDVSRLPSVYPGYWLNRMWETRSYNKVLSLYKIEKYKKIALYGDNEFLPYLIAEIAFQNGYDAIAGVVQTSALPHVRSAGLPLLSLEEVWDKIDCLVVNVRRNEDVVHDILDERERGFDVVDIYDIEQFEPAFYHPELAKYKDIHKGKRIFLVGNGPSLRFEDLEKLHEHHEICFGFNAVYKAYDQTSWRPTYWFSIDYPFIEELLSQVPDLSKMGKHVFLADYWNRQGPKIEMEGIEYIHIRRLWEDYYPNKPGFSSDIVHGVYDGFTIVYDFGIQLAAYMGASEIYLIGVDQSYHNRICKDDHFIKDYYSDAQLKQVEKLPIFDSQIRMQNAFEKAAAYSCAHGFRIYNATRGGKLEVFERVNFDSLF